MTISFLRTGQDRPVGEEIADACIEIQRRYSNETGFWWQMVGVGGDEKYIAFEYRPVIWPFYIEYPLET